MRSARATTERARGRRDVQYNAWGPPGRSTEIDAEAGRGGCRIVAHRARCGARDFAISVSRPGRDARACAPTRRERWCSLTGNAIAGELIRSRLARHAG